MGFFSDLFKTNIDNTELALQLFETQIVGSHTDKKYKYQVDKILKECTPTGKKYPERQQVLLKVIDLIGEPKNPKERFIIAKAYALSRVEYREKAIYYLELYLNNELWKDSYVHIIHNHQDTPEISKLYHLNEMYTYLAKAYEGLYNFDKSLKCYEYLIEIFPEHPSAYRGKATILIKQNNLSICYDWLKTIKKSEYYKVYYRPTVLGTKLKDSWFKDTIDELFQDVKYKIEQRLYL